MLDCKFLSTLMVPNLKFTRDEDEYFVYSTLYRQLIRSLMYLVNTRLDICYAVNKQSQFMVELLESHYKLVSMSDFLHLY